MRSSLQHRTGFRVSAVQLARMRDPCAWRLMAFGVARVGRAA